MLLNAAAYLVQPTLLLLCQMQSQSFQPKLPASCQLTFMHFVCLKLPASCQLTFMHFVSASSSLPALQARPVPVVRVPDHLTEAPK